MEGEEAPPPIQKDITVPLEEQKHVSRPKPNFFRRVVNNITIEPAMFVIAFAAHMDSVANEQLIVQKSCLTDFHYNATVCDHITEPQWKDEKKQQHNGIYQLHAKFIFYASSFQKIRFHEFWKVNWKINKMDIIRIWLMVRTLLL